MQADKNFFGTWLRLCLVAFSGIIASGQVAPVREMEEDHIQERRVEWFRKLRAYPGTTYPHDARIRAIGEMRKMMPRSAPVPRRLAAQAISSSQWTSIGPQPIGTSPYIYAGRVNDIAIDPRNSNVVYAGTDSGGVWKTSDGGTTWVPLTDNQPAISIQSITLDPTNPNTVYAGTGADYYGAGILKSTDAGSTWTQISGPFVYSYGGYTDITSIAVHPTNGQVVLAAASSLYRSTDGGVTWTQTYAVGTRQRAQKVFFDPANGSHAYASVDSVGILQSQDGGQTWSIANGAGSTALPVGTGYEVGFAIAPSNASILYASLRSTSGTYTLIGFYKSTNAGATWTSIGTPQNDNPSYWRWTLGVSPVNPNLVFAGLLDVYQSTNGGTAWTNVSNNTGYPHVDQHIQAFSVDGSKLYIGNDGGAWSTTAPSAASFTWANLNQTFSTALFPAGFGISPSDASVTLAGTQDNGTLLYQNNLNWTSSAGGDGGFAAIDFTTPTTIYHTYQEPYGIEKSTTLSPANWKAATTGINLGDSSEFYPPLVMDPSNSQRLYFGTYRVYQTNNAAGQWNAISGALGSSSSSTITIIGVSPADANTVFAGGYGFAQITRSALSASPVWSNISTGLPNRAVTQMAGDPRDSNTIYVTFSGYNYYDSAHTGSVYKSSNGGATWGSITGNLPNIPVNDILVDPDITSTLYVATDIGLFRSSDGGVSWLPLGSGLPNVVTIALKLQRATRTLRVGTYGRGMWDLWVPVGNQTQITITSSTASAPFSLEDGTKYTAPTTFSWTPGTSHTVTWLGTASGQAGTRYVFQSWADGGANPRTITVPTTATTYTANITTQYLLTTTQVPAIGGSLVITPSSPDGYYNVGTQVQIATTAASGYAFWYLSGDLSGTANPATITMNAAHSVTLNYYCQLNYPGYLYGPVGPGATTGFLIFQTGAGCNWSISSSTSWLSFSGGQSGTGSGAVAYAISANTGASRTATVTLSGDVTSTISLSQDVSTSSRPSISGFSPTSGAGANQIFTVQVSNPNGFTGVSYVSLDFESYPIGNRCNLSYGSGGTGSLFLENDAKTSFSSLRLPSTGTISNSQCQVNASQFSLSGSGKTATFNFGVTLLTAFSGNKYPNSYVQDSSSSLYSPTTYVGQWSVPGTPGTITIQTNPSGLQFSLDGGAVQTAPQTITLQQGLHTLAVTGTQVGPAGTQYVFTGWSDSGAASHMVTVGAVATSYTASFKTQYQLNTWASPGAGGSVSPVSGAYFDAGSIVPVVATASTGYFFSGWTGAAASSINASTTVTMSGPAAATAIFTPALMTLPGVPNYLGMFVSSNVLGNSVMYQSGQTVSVGGTASLGAMTLIGSVPSGDTAGMALYNSAGGGGASVSLDMYNTFANGGIPQAKIKALDDGAYSDHLTFWTKNPGAATNPVAERVRVTSTGRVGIGTKTPSAALEVAGSIKITGVGNGIIFPNGTTKSRGTVQGTTGSRFGVSAVDVGEKPGGVAFDGTAVWAVGGSGVTKVIAATGLKVGTYRVGLNPTGLAYDGFHVWVANAGNGTVTKLLAATGAVVGEYRVGESPQGVAFDGEHIWVANSGSGDVTELMAETGAVMGTFGVGDRPTGIAFDGTHVWVTNAGSGTVSKLLGGVAVGSYAVGTNPAGIAFDGKHVWVANSGSRDVMKLAANGVVVGTYAMEIAPVGVVFDGTDVWLSGESGIAFDGKGLWGANEVSKVTRIR